MTTLSFPDALQVVLFNGELEQAFSVPVRDAGEYISFVFVRKGAIVTKAAKCGFVFKTESDTAVAVRHGDFVGSSTFLPCECLQMVSVCVPTDYLGECLKDSMFRHFPTSGNFAYSPVSMTPSIRGCIDSLMDCTFTGPMRKLFMRGKAYELTTLASASLRTQRSFCTLTKQDIRHVHRARDILERSLDAPPTVPALARMVGTNDCKLKRDFKYAFQTTLHAYVISRRMQIAHDALQRGESSITSIAQRVGYSNTSHFSSTFFKHYGLLPREIKRVSRY